MEHKQIWNGREIHGYDPELAAHIRQKLSRELLPYALADQDRARRMLRRIMTDKDGNKYLADFDGNYIGPLPEGMRCSP